MLEEAKAAPGSSNLEICVVDLDSCSAPLHRQARTAIPFASRQIDLYLLDSMSSEQYRIRLIVHATACLMENPYIPPFHQRQFVAAMVRRASIMTLRWKL